MLPAPPLRNTNASAAARICSIQARRGTDVVRSSASTYRTAGGTPHSIPVLAVFHTGGGMRVVIDTHTRCRTRRREHRTYGPRLRYGKDVITRALRRGWRK